MTQLGMLRSPRQNASDGTVIHALGLHKGAVAKPSLQGRAWTAEMQLERGITTLANPANAYALCCFVTYLLSNERYCVITSTTSSPVRNLQLQHLQHC